MYATNIGATTRRVKIVVNCLKKHFCRARRHKRKMREILFLLQKFYTLNPQIRARVYFFTRRLVEFN